MFEGFSPEAPQFLAELKENNNKAWFETNRARYQEFLRAPMEALVTDLGMFMLSIDPFLNVSPKKTICRIHRDTRFSRDKSPYRTNVWFSFKRDNLDWNRSRHISLK